MSLRAAMGKQTALESEKEIPKEILSPSEAEKVVQRGKRADEEYTQLNVQIPKPMKLKFKSVTSLQDSDMSEVVEELIEGWLKKQEH